MVGYKISEAKGKYVIVESAEKSSVLKTEETGTVFKVIAAGVGLEYSLTEGELIIVALGSILKTNMGQREIFYVREDDIITTVDLIVDENG